MAILVFPLFNGIGRPLFGWPADRISPRYAVMLSFIIIFIASIGMANAKEGSYVCALYPTPALALIGVIWTILFMKPC